MNNKNESLPEGVDWSTHNPDTILEQYKIAVDLYKHEDNLNWTKLNNLFYINAGLWAVVGLIIQFGDVENDILPIDFRFFMIIISLIGMIISIALSVALWYGVEYMGNKKRQRLILKKG